MKSPIISTNRPAGWGSFDSPSLTPDHILAASRAHGRYLKTAGPREYQMRVFEDGSVFFLNIEIPQLSELFSFACIQEESLDFWLNPHRPLWRHILKIWE